MIKQIEEERLLLAVPERGYQWLVRPVYHHQALVAYLVSDVAGFLTGQTVVLDGGLTIVSPLSRLVDEKPPG